MIQILSRHYHIHFVALTDTDMSDEGIAFCERYCRDYKIFKKSKLQAVLNIVKYSYNYKPLQVNYYYFSDVQAYVDDKLKTCDFSITTLIRTAEYVMASKKPKYLDMVDSIGLHYKKSKNAVNSLWWKMIYRYESGRLLAYEKHCVRAVNNTFFVNKQEAEYWSRFGTTTWIPNGVNEKLFDYRKKNPQYKNHLVFFGKMDYQPNVDAVMWFVQNVMHAIDKKIKLIIVGANPSKKLQRLSKRHANIEITGFMEDPYEILNSALAVVAPMQSGGGMQNKILESMALGALTIVSTLGAKPIIGAVDKKHFLVCDNGSHMADLINDIANNKDNYNHLKENAMRLMQANYTWENYETKLLEILVEVAR